MMSGHRSSQKTERDQVNPSCGRLHHIPMSNSYCTLLSVDFELRGPQLLNGRGGGPIYQN